MVAEVESSEGFPLQQGSACQRTYAITPLFCQCKEKRGLAVDGHLREEDTLLASSTIMPQETARLAEFKENHGIVVRYMVKVRLVVTLGTDLKLNLPFILTHPKPQPAPEPVYNTSENPEPVKTDTLPPSYEALEPKPKLTEQNLIQFGDGPEDEDLVFEEFIRLRVSGDTDA